MKKRTSTTSKEPTFNVAKWMAEHRDFVEWWKEHRDGGIAWNRTHTASRWRTPPWQAWGIERYRAEYTGESEMFSQEEIAAMRADQRKFEQLSDDLEERFGKRFWETMTGKEFISAIKQLVLEKLGAELGQKMQANLEETYASEPGQPEAETEALRRRRGDDPF